MPEDEDSGIYSESNDRFLMDFMMLTGIKSLKPIIVEEITNLKYRHLNTI